MRKTSMFRRAMAGAVALALVNTGFVLGAADQPSPTRGSQPPRAHLFSPLQDAETRLTALLRGSATTLRSPDVADRFELILNGMKSDLAAIERDTFDIEAVARGLGSDIGKALEWVRDRTALAPYRGVLRGATGVLMDRQGNSLDRSLLLAELVRRGGSDVRLARAPLPRQTAIDVVSALYATTVKPRRQRVARFDAGFGTQYAARFGGDAAAIQSALEAWESAARQVGDAIARRSAAQAATLFQLVESTLDKSATSREPLIAAVADHWWVQVKRDTEWLDLDPVLLPQGIGRSPVRADVTAPTDKLPAELYHTVRLRIGIERWVGPRLEEVTVLDHPIRAADVVTAPITLVQLPASLPPDWNPLAHDGATERLRALLMAEREWVPVLHVGDQQISQNSFSLTGEVRPIGKDPKPAPATGMLDAFGGDEPAPASALLAGQFIEYDIIVPGTGSRTERRQLFDWIGASTRASGARPAALASDPGAVLEVVKETSILLLGAELSPEFIEYQTFGELLAGAELILTNLRQPQDTARMLSRVSRRRGARPEMRLYALEGGRHAWRQSASATYVASANVLTLHRGISANAGTPLSAWAAFDIVANDVGIFPQEGVRDAIARLSHGVTDSNAEVMVADVAPTSPGVSELMSDGRADPDKWVVVTKEGGKLSALNVPAESKASMDRALRQGMVVVLPRDISALPAGHVGWWVVDPATGRTLGMNSSGWGGQSLTEQLVRLIAYLISMVLSAQCFAKAAEGISSSATAVTACRFSVCIAWLVPAHMGLFMVKWTYAALFGPTLSLLGQNCSALG